MITFIYQKQFIKNVFYAKDKEDSNVISQTHCIKVHKITNYELVKSLETKLDKGEPEAIAFSLELNADIILLDDYEARKQAEILGMKIVGTLGVLLKAKKLNKIDSFKTELEKLRSSGFRISEDLEKKLLINIGEL